VIGDQLTEKCGKVASTMGDNVFVVLDGLIADYCFQPEELLVLDGVDINSDAAKVAWPFPREAAA
jgi:hypothetical protein